MITDIVLELLPVTGLMRAIKRSNEDLPSNWKSAYVCFHIFYNTFLFGYSAIELRNYCFGKPKLPEINQSR